MKTLHLTVIALAATMACATESPTTITERVAPTAESLESGSCVSACGGVSADGCYCDDACSSYGDCCPDYELACGTAQSGCQGDSDCGPGQACFAETVCAECSFNTPDCPCTEVGTCHDVPQGECLQDSDCGAAEYCDLMEVVNPGGGGFSVIGTCVANGECSSDEQCQSGQACVIETICAACSFDTPDCPCTDVGSCQDAPQGECLQDSDCGTAERCDLMEIVAPGGDGFMVIGSCVPNGECSTDEQCTGNQTCVVETICAACSFDTPDCPCTDVGSCQSLPQSECYADEDCDAGERCDLMELVGPGGTGFVTIGTCIAETASCDGYCGGQAADGCWCDSQCAYYGDCCADRDTTCG